MNVLDFVFGKTVGRDLPTALVDSGYVDRARLVDMFNMVKKDDFQSIMKLLVVMSDRKGREGRPEDSYASFVNDLTALLKGCEKVISTQDLTRSKK